MCVYTVIQKYTFFGKLVFLSLLVWTKVIEKLCSSWYHFFFLQEAAWGFEQCDVNIISKK